MTKQGYTAIKFLIDRSGSMQSTARDAIGGMKALINDQQKLDGKCTLSVSQFDSEYELVHGSTDIHHVPEPKLEPRGATALYDAWMKAIADFKAEILLMPKDERPENVIFVVITDGGENASREVTQKQVFDQVTKRTKKGWKFIYLGANQDAMSVGTSLGVTAGATQTYLPTRAGTIAAYAGTSQVISNLRTGAGDGTFTNSTTGGK